MSIFAVVNLDTNICENIILLDAESNWSPPEGFYIINTNGHQVGIGDTYNPDTKEWIIKVFSEENVIEPNLLQ